MPDSTATNAASYTTPRDTTLLARYTVGVRTLQTIELKRIDHDYLGPGEL